MILFILFRNQISVVYYSVLSNGEMLNSQVEEDLQVTPSLLENISVTGKAGQTYGDLLYMGDKQMLVSEWDLNFILLDVKPASIHYSSIEKAISDAYVDTGE